MPMNNRKKRGLINIVGTAQKWLFGTMDDEDRQMITQHVDEIRQNNRNAINVINKQVKINDYFNNTFQILKETIINDRETILKQVSSIQKIERRLILKQIYFDQLFKLKYINARVEHIQENIVSARNNILHPSILTNEEIETYKIDFFKLKQIKLGVTKYDDNTLIFAIKIPKNYVTLPLKVLTPIPNKEFMEVDADSEFTVEYKNRIYKFEQNKVLNELIESKHCIIRQNCKPRMNKQTEIIPFDDETILVKNFESNVNHTCDDRQLKISGNYLITFTNCTLYLMEHKFSNVKQIQKQRFYYPSYVENYKANKTLNFEKIVFDHIDNIKEIKEVEFKKNLSYQINIAFVVIILIMFAILSFLCIQQKRIQLKFTNRIQENSNHEEGEVTYHPAPDKYDEFIKSITTSAK